MALLIAEAADNLLSQDDVVPWMGSRPFMSPNRKNSDASDGHVAASDLLVDWERFLHRADDVDPLVRMTAAQHQFEAIDSFVDGNGRTGRMLNPLFLLILCLSTR